LQYICNAVFRFNKNEVLRFYYALGISSTPESYLVTVLLAVNINLHIAYLERSFCYRKQCKLGVREHGFVEKTAPLL
ncbi:hypothetical protein CHH80_08690, partial [Bacillus sp. 7504-2]